MILLKLLIIIIGTFLGTLAGAEGTSKGLRRVGIPAIITIFAIIKLFPIYGILSLYCISIMLMAIILGIGYGLFDYDCNGSAIGKFWYKFFPYSLINKYDKNRITVNCLTRGTVGLLVSLSLLSISKIGSNIAPVSGCAHGCASKSTMAIPPP